MIYSSSVLTGSKGFDFIKSSDSHFVITWPNIKRYHISQEIDIWSTQVNTWCRHQMETFPALLALCAGKFITAFYIITWSFSNVISWNTSGKYLQYNHCLDTWVRFIMKKVSDQKCNSHSKDGMIPRPSYIPNRISCIFFKCRMYDGSFFLSLNASLIPWQRQRPSVGW